MKVVVVGFKTSEENSILYEKLPFNKGMLDIELSAAVGNAMLKAYKLGADFVSVRFIRKPAGVDPDL